MNISIATVFPELYNSFLQTSLVARAQERSLVSINLLSYFSLVSAKERIGAPIFGHGSGMLIKPDLVDQAIATQEKHFGTAYKIFFSPHGKKLDQTVLSCIAQKIKDYGHVMLFPARYEGMDARVEQHYADEIISIGDFVLMGGDLPAMILLEGLMRLIPGVIGKEESVREESFSGPLVDHPSYTVPVVWKGYEVPEVMRSGNHAAQREWQQNEAMGRTVYGHFEWLRSYSLDDEQTQMAARIMPSHYVVLMHSEVLTGPEETLGTTSVTTIDIHDIARSSKTYGVKGYFIVTPLLDQQKIVRRLLDFWLGEEGSRYNRHRTQALEQVHVISSLDQVIEEIRTIEGKNPLVIVTSVHKEDLDKQITYHDQMKVWKERRPVLLIFGTGRGLAPQVIERADFMLAPLCGFSSYNHLSVRSAAGIILDRWLGKNER